MIITEVIPVSLKNIIVTSADTPAKQAARLMAALDAADAVVIGAGAGMSTAAGFEYSGERFYCYFADFEAKYGFRDMYTGGFNTFETPEEHWAYWSRFIFLNRYIDAPRPVYEQLYSLVRDKDYFVITTNVDHCFQKAGFDKARLFYTQGDYGLWQCSKPCHSKTYDNEETVRKMVEAQGFKTGENGLILPDGVSPKMSVPSELVPYCPKCGAPMTMNLRADDKFVEGEGWHDAASLYDAFSKRVSGTKVLYLELGVGGNTPGIIKIPFWQMTYQNPNATYACINFGEAFTHRDIQKQSICIDADIGAVFNDITAIMQKSDTGYIE